MLYRPGKKRFLYFGCNCRLFSLEHRDWICRWFNYAGNG